ncbi:MAG: hypothetical protein HFJ30_03325 [Clostridia bacterium]|jgi:hypothetical protein|nr:hypothetical protein [Clostridia bacterium]MCI9413318.1 hypothetical protein [Clostridia bacterium]
MIKEKRKSYLLGIIILAILAVIAIVPNMILSLTNEMTKVSAKKLAADRKYEIEEIANNTYTEADGTPYLEIKQFAFEHGEYGIAHYPGKVLYCIQHGVEFKGRDKKITLEQVAPYGDIYNPGSWIQQRIHICTRGPHGPLTYNGKRTYPVLWCVNHHYNVVTSDNYIPDAGYIITYPSTSDVTQEKQYALYNTDINTGKEEAPNAIYYEAVAYREFHDQTTDYGTNVDESDIKIEDKTELNEIVIKADNNEKSLIVGPFSIDYIYGYYEDKNIAFGGISDMYLVGYNSQGGIVKPKIEIKKYIDPKGKGYELEYFEPNEEDGSYVDRTKQVYPKGRSAGEDFFEVKIDNPNAGLPSDADESSYVAYCKLKIEFQWMTVTSAALCEKEAIVYRVEWKVEPVDTHEHCYETSDGEEVCWTCSHCKESSTVFEDEVQDHIEVLEGQRKLFKATLTIPDDDIPIEDIEDILIPLTMDLGGKVWEDMPDGKESLTDGKYTQNDRVMPNVKVTLYAEDGKIATLLSNSKKPGISDQDVMSRVNPTYTDEKGDYLFKGLDPLKKYYVQFEYNGQVYLPTDYEKNDGAYNRVDWFWTSKGTEKDSDRDNYDKTYSEIGSSPANYLVPSGSMKIAPLTNGYNESFSQYDLMGFKMTEDGDYAQETRLIDSFYKIEGGNIVETNENQEGEISKAIKDFIKQYKRSPKEGDMLNIYKKIAGGDEELLRKMQFIEDIKIKSYTKAMNTTKYDLYPIYDPGTFIINKTRNMKYTNAEEARSLSYDLKVKVIDGVTYKPIYPGQFYINQGLWRRQEVDLALRKDVLYAATRINGKTEVYEYNKRDLLTPEQKEELRQLRLKYEQNGRRPDDYQKYLDKKAEFEKANLEGQHGGYWQIQLRMRDYNNYYTGIHTRELYEADYNYRQNSTNKSGKDLELYVTYKITVRNVSQSILGEITEIVDYYDRDYIYRDDLSWVMYKNRSDSNDLNEINFTEAEYYDTIHEGALRGSISNNNKGTDSATNGRYEKDRSSKCRSDMTSDYDAIYIKGLENKKLASGEEAYIYLTFQVKSDDKGPVIVDDDKSLKENYVEINGYKTYYKDGTSLPNGVTKGSGDVAGLIDINSTPGNLCKKDLEGDKYEKNFENDTDRAKSVKVIVEEDFIRSINGTVWEDERTENVSNSMIGDGIRKDGELGVNGVTVELVEKLENGKEFLWQTTQSGSGKGRRVNLKTGQPEDYTYKVKNRGYYEFSESITGNYIIRFHYGDKTLTVQTDSNGGSNATSYNGQDFKSTLYQTDIKQDGKTDRLGNYFGYTDTEKQNETGTGPYGTIGAYGYDIHAADSLGKNVSDAKDIWSYRQKTIEYSNNKVTNHIAEVLAAPYTENAKKADMIQELIDRTQMVAETGVIVLEGEYNRTGTDGYYKENGNGNTVSNGSSGYLHGNDVNGNYTLNNVDFGLAERPKAQLELGKKITNVQIKLANGNILFDANKGMTDLMWTPGTPYELNDVGIIDSNKDNKYQQFYSLNNHRYTYRTQQGTKAYSVNGLVASKYKNNGNNGSIVATMDEELMQGANITISYLLTVTNVGETDYEGEEFYYLGEGANTVVTTRADVVTDYVANNLNFNENTKNNNEDSTTNKENGWKITNNVLTTLGLNNNLATKVSQYNNVINTENLHDELIPVDSKSKQHANSSTVGLVLTQLINPENSTDDKTYDNVAEITTISNTVGRRMAYSIQGNQDPTADASEEGKFEVDAVKSERVTILPPFGIGNTVVYIAIAVSVLVILAGGIILIKRKVLNK